MPGVMLARVCLIHVPGYVYRPEHFRAIARAGALALARRVARRARARSGGRCDARADGGVPAGR